ncbi:MAG: orotidine 5'-phosphate decarboxylase / HUMPS family protein [Oenococcus sp.]|uniref:orotidine 5'-phosphate decarboxylase / HUMPS family protein n=1 Tax=Oenococcus sp. TaxID=1979414 RepID=UPI0039E7CA1D
MKLQVAIDRKPLNETIALAKALDPVVDIVEIGTSVIKDFGFVALKDLKSQLHHAQLLLDIKTNDEGDYEFKAGFDAKADILTVMGAMDHATLSKTYQVAQDRKKDMFIDLMAMSEQQIAQITDFHQAIFGLHHSHDSSQNFAPTDSVAAFHEQFPSIKRVAVAGGINLTSAKALAAQGLTEIVIVGGAIAGSDDPLASAKEFMEVIK